MKNLLIFALIISSTLATQAQSKFGIRGGLSTMDLEANDLLIFNANDSEQLKVAFNEAQYGMHLGLFYQYKGKRFFIQPEVLFNSNNVEYTVENFEDGNWVSTIKNERYQHLDIPLMVGLRLGPLRLGAGPVGHVFINNISELSDFDGYDDKFDTMTFGWQTGVGLDIWKAVIDVKWERNLSNFGDHINFFGREYNFDDKPGRLVVSLGIDF